MWPTSGILSGPAPAELKMGLLWGLLTGYCGYYVEIENVSADSDKEITIFKSAAEFYNIAIIPLQNKIMALVAASAVSFWL